MFKLEKQPIQTIKELKKQGKDKEAAEFAKLVASDPLRYWVPNLVQERIIKELIEVEQESRVPTLLITSGNGTGKTSAVVNIVCNLVYQPQSGWFDYDLFKNYPNPTHITLVTTPKNINENYFSTSSGAPSFNNFLWNRKDIEYSKGGKNHIDSVKFSNTGWSLSVITYNQAKSELESFTTGLFIFDEPPPLHFWEAIPARTRKGALVLMPMTPLECEPFIQDQIIDKADAGIPGYRHIKTSTLEVLDDKPRGHYNKKVFEAQAEKYSKDEYESRVKGNLMYFKERIIDTLDESIHRVNPEEYPLKQNYMYFHVFDPGDGKPNMELWGAVTPEGRKIIFYEAPVDQEQDFWEMRGGTTVKNHIIQTLFIEKQLEHKYGFRMNFTRIVDYHFAQQTRGGLKTNLYEDYYRESTKIDVSFPLIESYNTTGGAESELIFGHKRIRTDLQYLPDGKPGLVIYNNCFHVWRGLTHYVRKRAKTEAEMMLPPTSRRIIQKYKDAADVVRYFVCHNVYFKKKEKPTRREYVQQGTAGTL